jgi:hypothetical protein
LPGAWSRGDTDINRCKLRVRVNLGNWAVLEVELERFPEVGKRLLVGVAVAGDLHRQTAGDIDRTEVVAFAITQSLARTQRMLRVEAQASLARGEDGGPAADGP